MTIERIPNQQDLSWFIDMRGGKKLELNPPYQRRSVWTTKDKKFFLDTIFNNYPCPAIYLQKQITDNYIQINKIKSFLLKHWDVSCLAKNLKRECESINTILKVSKIELNVLENIINKQTLVNRGASLINLSPHGAIIQSLLDVRHQGFIEYIQKKIDHTRSGKMILIVDEIEVPDDIILNQNTYGQRIQYYKNCAKYFPKETN